MKRASYGHRECLEDAAGTKYFFGRHGYVEIIYDVATAHITDPASFLRDSKFSDEVARRSGKAQRLPVSSHGLKGMLEHLAVSPYAKNQKESTLYLRLKGNQSTPQYQEIIG